MKLARIATRRGIVVALLLSAWALVLAGVGPRPANADVSAVSGRAYGEFVSISLFGGPPFVSGPAPEVNLPPAGGLVTDTLPSVTFGPPGNPPPVVFLSTGPMSVSTSGQTGPIGSSTSTASVATPKALRASSAMLGFFDATSVSSTCTQSEAGGTGSATLTGATLNVGENPSQLLPPNPAPNTTINGTNPDTGDPFRVVLNEQVVTPTSITVNAVHIYLLGETAVGDVILARTECGVTVVAPPTTTTSTTSTSTSTTVPTTTSTSTSTTSTSTSTTSTSTTSTSTTSTSTTIPTTTSTSTTSTSTTIPTTTSTSTTSTSTTVPTTSTSTTRPSTTTSTTTGGPSTCGGLTPTITGTGGNDNITGTAGPDVIVGLGGNDSIQSLGGDDVVCGGDGGDRILGGTGNDRLFGDAGNDQLFGEAGNDQVSGGAGSDRVSGGDGNDALNGDAGTDQCLGDAGTDSAATCESTIGVP